MAQPARDSSLPNFNLLENGRRRDWKTLEKMDYEPKFVREVWTDAEKAKFYKAVQLFGLNWKKISVYVGGRSYNQLYGFKRSL